MTENLKYEQPVTELGAFRMQCHKKSGHVMKLYFVSKGMCS
jgi:hypothetical protein